MNVKHLTKAVLVIGAIFLLLAGTPPGASCGEAENVEVHNSAAATSRAGSGAIITSVTIEGGAFSSPAVSGGRVYIGTLEGDVLCFDAVSGSRIWEFEANAEVVSSPAVHDGNVYAGCYDGRLYCLAADTGSKLWEFAAGDLVGSSPAIHDGNVYAGSYYNSDKKNKTVFCLNALTGNKIWEFATDSDVESSPAVADGYVYIGSTDKKIYCLTAEAGNRVWDFTTGGMVVSSPAIAEGLVYAGSFDGRLYCLDGLTGNKVWEFNTGKSIVFSSPALANGFVYIMNMDGTVYCLDAETGTEEWEFATFSVELLSSPAVTGKYVYVKSTGGTVYCLNALTGAEVWKSALGETENLGSSPAISGGVLYVGGQELFYLAVAADETGSWPMYRCNPARTGALTAPEADFTAAPITGNAPLAVIFTDASAGAVNAWSWDFGDGATSSEQNPQHTYNTAGTYSVRLTVSGPGGYDTFTRVNCISMRQNALQAEFFASVTSGSAPLTARFTDSSTGTITAYQWNFGDGKGSTEKNPQHTYPHPGIYTVSLTVTGPEEDSDTELKEGYVEVAAPPGSYSLSGSVSKDAREGVTIFLNGSQRQAETDEDGAYSFNGMKSGTYTVTPFKSATTFVPPSREVTVQNRNVEGVDFIAKADRPEIVEAYASRTAVPADGTTPVVFFVQVSHPLGLQTISSVRINLQPIGRSSSQQMHDDGSNGDQTAGDGFYSLQTTVAPGTAPQLAGLAVEVTDSQDQNAQATIGINVTSVFNGSLGSLGGVTVPITNTVLGSTIIINYTGLITGTFMADTASDLDSRQSASRAGSPCFPLLQILKPDGTPYLADNLPITNSKYALEIRNAAAGVWKYLITNECTENKNVRLTTSSSGTGLVSGTVIDAATGESVDGAAVTTDAGVTAATDAGFYTFISPAGAFILEASADEFGSAAKSVVLNAGEAIEVNLALGEESSGGCAASSVLPGDRENLALLRLFRDTVLRKTDGGNQYVRRYYQHGPEVVRLLAADPALRAELRGCLLRALPLAVRLCSGRAAPMDAAQISAMERCLQKLAARGSAALQADIAGVRAGIQDQSIFKELGVSIEGKTAR